MPATIVGRSVGIQADDRAATVFVHVGQAGEQHLDRCQHQRVTVDACRVVGVELEVDGRGGRGGAGYGDGLLDWRALLGWQAVEDGGARVECKVLELRGGRRVGVDVALAHAHDADVQGDVKAGGAPEADDELGGAAADVDDDGGLGGGRTTGHGAEKGELRLFGAGEDAGIKVEIRPYAGREVPTVGCVANGRGEHGEVGLTAVGVDLGAVVGERVEHARNGFRR